MADIEVGNVALLDAAAPMGGPADADQSHARPCATVKAPAGFGPKFDAHFRTCSSGIRDALQGLPLDDPDVQRIPQIIDKPEYWGIKVGDLHSFFLYVADDLAGYVAAHSIDANFKHVCLSDSCCWDHNGAQTTTSHCAAAPVCAMRPNMHLVVQRYIKPWTRNMGAGFAFLLNTAYVAVKEDSSIRPAKVFVSHTWNENFQDSALTLHRALDPDTMVWICSFAIYQHGDVAGALTSLEECPFAVAMNASEQVLVITDSTAECFERCWCDLEAVLALKTGKAYDISLPDDGDEALWQTVGARLEKLDIAQCRASRAEDKEAILEYARNQEGGIQSVNDAIKTVGRNAMQRARVAAAATSGDITWLSSFTDAELGDWRSHHGRTATHVAVAHSRVAAVAHLLQRTCLSHLEVLDADGRSPLSVAAEGNSIAGVAALLSFGARTESCSGLGLTPLHYAAAGGHWVVAMSLLQAGADKEAKCRYQGRSGARPLHLAAFENRAEMVSLLAASGASVNSPLDNGLRSTPLLWAARVGAVAAGGALLAARASADCRDAGGRTPLMVASRFGNDVFVRMLLGSGAKIRARDRASRDARSYVDMCREANRAVEAECARQALNDFWVHHGRCSDRCTDRCCVQ